MDPKDRNLPDEADDMDELLEKMDEEYELMEVTLFISAVVGGGLAAWISTSEGRILSFPVVAVRIALRMLSASGCWLKEEGCDMAGFNMELELDRGENIVRGDWRPLGRPEISSIDGRLLTQTRGPRSGRADGVRAIRKGHQSSILVLVLWVVVVDRAYVSEWVTEQRWDSVAVRKRQVKWFAEL